MRTIVILFVKICKRSSEFVRPLKLFKSTIIPRNHTTIAIQLYHNRTTNKKGGDKEYYYITL